MLSSQHGNLWRGRTPSMSKPPRLPYYFVGSLLCAGAFYNRGPLDPRYNPVSTHCAVPVQQDESKTEARLRQENGSTEGGRSGAGFY